jgi:replication factor A1
MLPIKFKDILEEIKQAIPNLKEDQLREMVKNRKEEAGGLLTDEGAAHIVAYELGVTLEGKERFDTEIHIENLSQGINDISITGRVLLIGSTRSFTRKDGSEGKVKKLLIGDSTGFVDVTVWDDKTATVTEEEIKPDEIVRVSHAYVREGLYGQLELNVGKRGSISKILDKSSKKYPQIQDYFRSIESIREDTKFLSLKGKIKQIYSSSEFKRTDGTDGKVQRILLSDNTGDIICVFWDEKVELVNNFGIDDFIKITGARVRKGREEIEIHTVTSSEIETIRGRDPDKRESTPITISDIRAGMVGLNLLAWVVQVGNSRRFKTRDGNEGEVVTILLSDETGTIRLNLWDDMSRRASNIERGQYVSIKNAYSKTWLEIISLNLGSNGEILVSQQPDLPEKISKLIFELKKIAELEDNQNFVSIKGRISKNPQTRTVMTNRQSEVKVVTFSVKDDSGEIDVTFWGELASIIEELDVGKELVIRGAQVESRGREKNLKSNVLTTVDIS